MPVTEADRYRLYDSLRTTLGTAEADTFINLMPPFDWTDVATKADLAELRADLRADMAELRGDLRAEMAQLGGELRADMGELRGDLQKTLGTWLFASQTAVVAAVAVIVGLVR
jgi:hypothetical protein